MNEWEGWGKKRRERREEENGDFGIWESLLVAIADEEIRIQLLQVQRDMSDPVRSVDEAEDALFAAFDRQLLEGEAHAGHGNDGVEEGELGIQPLRADVFHRRAEIAHDGPEGTRESVIDSEGGQLRLGFSDGLDGLFAAAIDSVETVLE